MTSLFILKGMFLLIGGYISFVDFQFGKIPNRAVCFFVLPLVLWMREDGLWREHLICGVLSLFLISGLFYGIKFFKKMIPLGGGDLKLFPVLGTFNTLSSFPLFLILRGVFAGVTALILRQKKFPLGPALVGASFFAIL